MINQEPAVPQIIPKDHKDYRTWVYNRIDGKMEAKTVDGPTAEKLYEEGWRMNPAEFVENENLKDNPEFEASADDIAQLLNFLLNIEKCEDKEKLKEFATGLLGMEVDGRFGIKKLKEQIVEEARKKGLYEETEPTTEKE